MCHVLTANNCFLDTLQPYVTVPSCFQLYALPHFFIELFVPVFAHGSEVRCLHFERVVMLCSFLDIAQRVVHPSLLVELFAPLFFLLLSILFDLIYRNKCFRKERKRMRRCILYEFSPLFRTHLLVVFDLISQSFLILLGKVPPC